MGGRRGYMVGGYTVGDDPKKSSDTGFNAGTVVSPSALAKMKLNGLGRTENQMADREEMFEMFQEFLSTKRRRGDDPNDDGGNNHEWGNVGVRHQTVREFDSRTLMGRARSIGAIQDVGFDEGGVAVAAGATAQLTAQNDKAGLFNKLILTGDLAAFIITDMRAGGNTISVGGGGIPAGAFQMVDSLENIAVPYLTSNSRIILNVTNVSAAPATLRGSLRGFAIQLG